MYVCMYVCMYVVCVNVCKKVEAVHIPPLLSIFSLPPSLLSPLPPPPPPSLPPYTQKFCSSLLSSLSVTSSPSSWSLETKALALTALRIFAREQAATDSLTCVAGLRPIVELAELNSDLKESCFASGEFVPNCKVQGT